MSSSPEARPLLHTASSSDFSPVTAISSSSTGRISYPSILIKNLFGDVFVLIAISSLIIFLLQLWKILYLNPAGLFTYHPALNSLAIAGFTLGILLLQPISSNKLEKTKGLKLHQIFQYTALPLILSGTILIIYNKIIHSAKHFTTYHGLLGITTLSLILIQIAFGAIMLYAPLTHILGGEVKAKKYWKYHRMSGYVTLSLLLLTPLLAVGWSGWMVPNSTKNERIIMGLGLVGVGIGIGGRIRKSKLGL